MTLGPSPPIPVCRRLAIYAFDPSLATENRTAALSKVVISLPWDAAYDAPMRPGPVNEYLEVVDVDPASSHYYPPVDLDHPYLLAADGYAPSESNPRFHQQMAFAVAMRTIVAFETALGRRVLWSLSRNGYRYMPRLRIYPHALRQENAYYSPSKKALLFGYYQATADDAHSLPGMWVFGCLSHDIVAHETTHALVDGVNENLIEDVGLDSLAFHEGFADIVALLQHFTFDEAVREEIAAAAADLDKPTLLSGLALQFGEASRRSPLGSPKKPLRDAIDALTKGQPGDAPDNLARFVEAHGRGARLLAAVYAALLEIYERAANPILEIAAPRAPGAPLHPRLVEMLAAQVSAAAGHVLSMCIRALDYLPPTSVTFGDFLRAIVTADHDLYPADDRGYRRALIGAFRRFGVITEGVNSLAEESLLWRLERNSLTTNGAPLPGEEDLDLDPLFQREALFNQSRRNAATLHGVLMSNRRLRAALGLAVEADPAGLPEDIKRSIACKDGAPIVQVHAFRMARRVSGEGTQLRQLAIGLTQRRFGYIDPDMQRRADAGEAGLPDPDFTLRGGVSLVIDLRLYRSPRSANPETPGDTPTSIFSLPHYVVRQSVEDDERLEALRAYHANAATGASAFAATASEPLAMLHERINAGG